MEPISPAVVTSKAAQRDFETIKGRHADLLVGIENQATQRSAYQQQKASEAANQASMDNEIKKEQMTADTNNQKNALDFQQKQSELDVKRASLV